MHFLINSKKKLNNHSKISHKDWLINLASKKRLTKNFLKTLLKNLFEPEIRENAYEI